MHINSMPDLVLRRVFHKVPLQDLLNAGRVCPLWKYYQVETGKRVRSLTLLIGPNDTHQFITKSCFTLKYRDLLLNDDGTRMYSPQYLPKRFHLTYSSFSLDCVDELLDIFPHITTLEIATKDIETQITMLNSVVTLLAHWSAVLKTLKMYIQFKKYWNCWGRIYFDKVEDEIVALFKTLNSMPMLEHLTLECAFSLRSFCMEVIRQFGGVNSILGRLREFYFKSQKDQFEIIEHALKCFAVSNENLKQIGLICFPTFGSIFRELYRLYPQLANRIVRLDSHNFQYLSLVMDIMPNFSSITYLHIRVDGHLLHDNLNCLSSLRQLSHLHLITVPNFFRTQTVFSRDQLFPLISVQVLIISTAFQSTSAFESTFWDYLFSNVQVVELILSQHNFVDNPTGRVYLSKQQLRKTLSPFGQIPKLHHLYTAEPHSYSDREQPSKSTEWIVLQVRDCKIIINTKGSYNNNSMENFNSPFSNEILLF